MIILKILQKCIDAVAKVLAWLLVKMGLWLSVIYVITFFVICALTDTAFSSVQNLFWTCLAVSVVLGLWLSLSLAGKAKKKEGGDRAVANIPKVKKKNGKEDYEESRESYAGLVDKAKEQQPVPQVTYIAPTQPYYTPQYVQPIVQPIVQQPVIQPVISPQPIYPTPQYQQPSNDGSSIFTPYHQQPYVQPQPQPQPQQPQQMSARDILFSQTEQPKPQSNDDGQFLKYPRPNDMAGRPSDAISPLEAQTAPSDNNYNAPRPRNDLYSQPQPMQNYGSQPMQNYGNEFAQPSYTQPSYSPRQNNSFDNLEKPRIYRTHADPDVLIYEYSNRLDYYRRTPNNGLVFERTVYKDRK